MNQVHSSGVMSWSLLSGLGWGSRGRPGLPPAIDPRTKLVPGRPHTITGDVCPYPGFHSQFLPTDRDVLVWLLPGYHAQPWRRYPVLYLQDAQNLFDNATSVQPGSEWHVDGTAQVLIQAGVVEPRIIVGIDNAGAQRPEASHL